MYVFIHYTNSIINYMCIRNISKNKNYFFFFFTFLHKYKYCKTDFFYNHNILSLRLAFFSLLPIPDFSGAHYFSFNCFPQITS